MAKPNPDIQLVLGGGGARGLAHIPALEAFDELGLKPANIAGTSMGAMMGAAYASGVSGREIRHHTTRLLNDKGALLAKLWGIRPKVSIGWGSAKLGQFDAEQVLETVLPATVAERIEDTDIPLKIVATDYFGWREKVFGEGPLRPRVAASIALPAIFRPVTIDNLVLIDGGASNALPFDHVPEAGITVALDVMGGPMPEEDKEIPSPTSVVFGAMQILSQTITASKLEDYHPEILLRPPTDHFKVLDFLKIDEILAAAVPLKEDLKRALDRAFEEYHAT
jgi:NTE family protein